jgi:hypothetical protein
MRTGSSRENRPLDGIAFLMRRLVPIALLLLCTALVGCSSSTPKPSTPGPTTASASTSAPQTSAARASSASATPDADPAGGSGTITFKGKVSGKMTISACPGGGIAQLTVDVDGQDSTLTGIIDADDFTFVGPNSTAYTLAKGASKPRISGKTYTVSDTKLVGITNDDTVTASGSVSCP